MKHKDGLSLCSRKCKELNTECPVKDCRLWIDYKNEQAIVRTHKNLKTSN